MKGCQSRIGAQIVVAALPTVTRWPSSITTCVCSQVIAGAAGVAVRSHGQLSVPQACGYHGPYFCHIAKFLNSFNKYFSLNQFFSPSNVDFSNMTCETTGLICMTNYLNKNSVVHTP